MIRKHLRRNRNGDFQLTIKVTGEQDVYRFASHLLSGQCEFADLGRRSLRSLRTQTQPSHWNYMLRALAGPATQFFSPKPMPNPVRKLCSDAGMPPEQADKVVTAVSEFIDDDLKLRAAQALVHAWEAETAAAT